MFRFSRRTLGTLDTGLKAFNTLRRERRTLLRITPKSARAAFYSQEAKSPLATLIQQQQQQDDKHRKSAADDAKEKQKSKEKSWKHMKYTLIFFGLSFVSGGVYLLIELGRPKYDDEGVLILDQFTNMPTWKQYIYRTFNELNYYGQLIKEPSREKLLPDMIDIPAYHPRYTLVLEFTDVIVHPEWTYKTGWRFKKRPGLDNFLESLHGTYEVVVYTAEQGLTVFPIIDALDPRNLINYKLVRDATLFVDGKHVKDLDKLNRDLSKVVVVDWNGDCTKFHEENVLRVPRWAGNDDDTDLLALSSFLLAISHNRIEDVREVLKVYREYDNPLAVYKQRQKELIERAEQNAEEEREKTANSRISRWRPSFLKRNF